MNWSHRYSMHSVPQLSLMIGLLGTVSERGNAGLVHLEMLMSLQIDIVSESRGVFYGFSCYPAGSFGGVLVKFPHHSKK